MTDYEICNETRETRTLKVDGEPADIFIEVLDYFPCLDSWEYRAPYTTTDTILPDREEREMRAWFYGKDMIHCRLRCTYADGTEEYAFVSIVRSIVPPYDRNDDVDWQSSCMVRDRRNIQFRHGEVQTRYHGGGDHEMLWDATHLDSPVLWDRLLDTLADECYRIFTDSIPTGR